MPKPPLFHVGQEVVALISDWLEPEEAKGLGYPTNLPKKGVQYTIASMGWRFGFWGLNLAGIEPLGYDEQYFAAVKEHPGEAIAALLEESLCQEA